MDDKTYLAPFASAGVIGGAAYLLLSKVTDRTAASMLDARMRLIIGNRQELRSYMDRVKEMKSRLNLEEHFMPDFAKEFKDSIWGKLASATPKMAYYYAGGSQVDSKISSIRSNLDDVLEQYCRVDLNLEDAQKQLQYTKFLFNESKYDAALRSAKPAIDKVESTVPFLEQTLGHYNNIKSSLETLHEIDVPQPPPRVVTTVTSVIPNPETNYRTFGTWLLTKGVQKLRSVANTVANTADDVIVGTDSALRARACRMLSDRIRHDDNVRLGIDEVNIGISKTRQKIQEIQTECRTARQMQLDNAQKLEYARYAPIGAGAVAALVTYLVVKKIKDKIMGCKNGETRRETSREEVQ